MTKPRSVLRGTLDFLDLPNAIPQDAYIAQHPAAQAQRALLWKQVMKKLLSAFTLMLVTLLAYSTPVYAKGIPLFFGEQEEIHKIADVSLKGGEGEDLFLGYKTRGLYILAGIYVADEGYVLGMAGDESKYYPFPSGDELKAFQESGMLPEKLPEYSLSPLDYIFGYSLWLIVLLGLLYYFMKKALVKRDH